MKSIKTKIIGTFCLILLIFNSIIGFVSYNTLMTSLTKNGKNTLSEVTKEKSIILGNEIKAQIKQLEIIADKEYIRDLNKDKSILSRKMKNDVDNYGFLFMGFTDEDGLCYGSDGRTYDLNDRQYFKEAITGKASVSEPLINKADGSIIMVFAVPVKVNGQVMGVLSIDRTADFIGNILKGGNNNVESFILNKKGNLMAHSNTEMIKEEHNLLKEFETSPDYVQALKGIISGDNNTRSYSINENDYLINGAKIEGVDWFIAISGDSKVWTVGVEEAQRTNIFMNSFLLVVSIIVAYLVGSSISNPIKEITIRAKKIAKGDLNTNISDKLLSKKDEVGELAKALNDLNNNMHGLIKDIKVASNEVGDLSQELLHNSKQGLETLEDMSKTIEEVANSATNQANSTKEGAFQLNELSKFINVNKENINIMNNSSSKISNLVNEGLILIKDLGEKTIENNESSKFIYEEILNTNKKSDKINEASNIITSIAEQTNLLALNAAIEAARVGEAGRGFAVVAEEIRKLAEESTKSTEVIEAMVKELQQSSNKAVEIVKEDLIINEQQVKQSKDIEIKYNSISSAIDEVLKKIIELDKSQTTILETKDQVTSIVRELSHIAQQNAAATQQTAASTQEQTTISHLVSTNTESLIKISKELQSHITKFNI